MCLWNDVRNQCQSSPLDGICHLPMLWRIYTGLMIEPASSIAHGSQIHQIYSHTYRKQQKFLYLIISFARLQTLFICLYRHIPSITFPTYSTSTLNPITPHSPSRISLWHRRFPHLLNILQSAIFASSQSSSIAAWHIETCRDFSWPCGCDFANQGEIY